jgi:hypothetical protein
MSYLLTLVIIGLIALGAVLAIVAAFSWLVVIIVRDARAGRNGPPGE